ncbi:MAG TPA: TIGR03086 family metal-binding protein [Iamia sp.]
MAVSLISLLDVAVVGFEGRLVEVGESDWARPTPCSEWDVHYLVAHVVGGNRFAALVLDGAASADALDEVMGRPQLGDAPVVDFETSAQEQRRRFCRDGVLARRVSHPTGDISGERFLQMRVYDIALHTWDLGTALGGDPTLDGELVDTVLAFVDGLPAGMVGADAATVSEVKPSSGLERLLALTGRG